MADFAQLVEVRSQHAEAMIGYLRGVEQKLSRNVLLAKFGRTLDNSLRMPLHVEPYEAARHQPNAQDTEHGRQAVAVDDDDKQSTRRLYAMRDHDREDKPPQPLDELEATLHQAVLLGNPGSGKTEWLKHQVATRAGDLRRQLEARLIGDHEVVAPVFLPLNDVAELLGRTESQAQSQAGVLKLWLVQHWCVSKEHTLDDADRFAAAMLLAMVKRGGLPVRLVHWMWLQWIASRSSATSVLGEPPASLICLDAWDEVRRGRKILMPCLQAFTRQRQVRLFLTSRIVGYDDQMLPLAGDGGSPREWSILPFGWDQTQTFVTSFFDNDAARGIQMCQELTAKPAINGMAQNPLLATLLCMAFSPDAHQAPLSFPVRRGDVYERILRGLMLDWRYRRRDQPKPRDAATLMQRKLRLLEAMAFHFFPEHEFSLDDLDAFLWSGEHAYMATLNASDPLRRLGDLISRLCDDGVLVPSGSDATSLRFLHLTFHEYLVACHVARAVNTCPSGWNDARVRLPVGREVRVADLIDRKAWHPDWEEAVILLAGRLKRVADVAAMFDLLRDASRDCDARERFCLLVRCTHEVDLDKLG